MPGTINYIWSFPCGHSCIHNSITKNILAIRNERDKWRPAYSEEYVDFIENGSILSVWHVYMT